MKSLTEVRNFCLSCFNRMQTSSVMFCDVTTFSVATQLFCHIERFHRFLKNVDTFNRVSPSVETYCSISQSFILCLKLYTIDQSFALCLHPWFTLIVKAQQGGAEGVQDPSLAIRISMFVFLVFHQHCKSRSGSLQNVLQRYHKA